ncbi:MAG: hypothetical protein MSC31_08760 [Solirubrobacteraceae bacterium MAG38_C4-C5]|nr:hypothetical protein [Candidatus Siliceabacter maunaloa]
MRHHWPVPLNRVAWIATTAASVLIAILLFLGGYTGYGVLGLVVALSAGINLAPERT